jgi:hypothetical protein
MELCGGMMADVSSLELMKRDDLQFQFVDSDDFDDATDDDDDDDEDDDAEAGSIDEQGELTDYDDEDDEYY